VTTEACYQLTTVYLKLFVIRAAYFVIRTEPLLRRLRLLSVVGGGALWLASVVFVVYKSWLSVF
jgi:hypothetical protein